MTLSSLEIEALQLSLQVALCAVGVSLPLGIGVAFARNLSATAPGLITKLWKQNSPIQIFG